MNLIEILKELEELAHKLDLSLCGLIGIMQAAEDLKKIWGCRRCARAIEP